MIDWAKIGDVVLNMTYAACVGFGATMGLGNGTGLVSYLHFMPAPYEDQEWLGSVYDWLQDRAKNNKVGTRRKRDKPPPEPP